MKAARLFLTLMTVITWLSVSAEEATMNLAPMAAPSAFYTSSWTTLASVNDGNIYYTGDVASNYWGSWSNSRPSEGWVQYDWNSEFWFTSCNVHFWTDRSEDTGWGDNVPVPENYKIQYWNGTDWQDVVLSEGSSYSKKRNEANSFSFEAIKTSKLRIMMNAQTNGTTYSAFGLTEWECLGYSDEPMINSKEKYILLGQNRRFRNSSLSLNAVGASDEGASISLSASMPGVNFSPKALSKEEIEAGTTVAFTFDPTADGAATILGDIIIKTGNTELKVPLMTSMDEGFEEKNADVVYDPCFYSMEHISTWSTAPTIVYMSDGEDVKSGATCLKFEGTSGIEYRNNIYWSPGSYVISGWIKTNGTFECGAYGTGCGFSSAEPSVISQEANNINFLISDTGGEWKQFSFTFTVKNGALGGAWVNNDRNKTSKLTWLDNLQIYRTDAPNTQLTTLEGDYNIQPVSFADVHFNDNFWSPRQKQNIDVTIPYFLQKCEDAGRILNFRRADAIYHNHDYSLGYYSSAFTFDDTDLYKVLEGMAYGYQVNPTPDMDQQMDYYIDIIAKAQEDDGYLYTARTAGDPGHYHSWVGPTRWVWDPNLSHELYNCGHLYEAAYAHYLATGKDNFLKIALKNADLLVNDFLNGGLTYEPGHQIVEMGLVKLYRITHKSEYLQLAKYFLDLRGDKGSLRSEYSQSHRPVIWQDEAVGHAVRAAYMYSGMVDVATIGGVQPYQDASDALWDNMVEKKLYLTGGIGALHSGESFGANYELPNKTAYNETCAAIANVYWNWRQFLTYGDAKYYDVLERALYNNVIAGIGMNGNTFFYPNPLSADGLYHFNSDNTIGRGPWFSCTCCLSNLTRFIASVPGYMYAQKDDNIYVNLFAKSTGNITLDNGDKITLTQTTNYPWEGNVKITVGQAENKTEDYTLSIRVPGWSRNQPVPSELYTYKYAESTPMAVSVNGEPIDITPDEHGYLVINRSWNVGDYVEVSFDMAPHHVFANSLVAEDAGRVALERGPLVYCLESHDNYSLDVNEATMGANAEINVLNNRSINVSDASDSQLTKLTKLTAKGTLKSGGNDVQRTLTFIPYYAWANRSNNSTMEVWVKVNNELTPVESIKTDKNKELAPTYNISGQTVDDNTKGIVIRNGKKIFNK